MSGLFKVTIGVGVAVAFGGSFFQQTSHAQVESSIKTSDEFQGFLNQYCVTCHTDRRHQAGAVPISLEELDVADVVALA